MIWKAGFVLALALGVFCDGPPAISEQKVTQQFSGHHGHLSHIGEHAPEQHDVYAWSYPSYQFSYLVNDPHTHDNKGQEEARDGDKVSGLYWLIQPDGLKRIVKYSSDHKNGFHADVEFVPVHGGHHEEHQLIHQNHERHTDIRMHADEHQNHDERHKTSHEHREAHEERRDRHDKLRVHHGHDSRRNHHNQHDNRRFYLDSLRKLYGDRNDGDDNHRDHSEGLHHDQYHGPIVRHVPYGHRLHI